MTGATHNGNDFISRLREIVEANFHDENFGVSDLVQKSGKSHSWVHRYLKKHNNQSVSYFIRKVRLEKSMEMLIQSDESASEIAFRVGFGSPAYFNHCFHEHFGFPPGEARKRAMNLHENESITGSLEQQSRQDAINSASRRKGKSRKKKVVWIAVSVVFLLALFAQPVYNLFFAGATKQKELAASEKSIVVLPFKNLSSDTDNQYFADGITEDILNRLSGIPGLKVVSRTSAEQFRESTLDAREISRQLGVNFLLEGSVRRHDDQVRISVQFIDARTDQHIWSENYDRQMTGIFAIQSDIAQNVATELQTALTAAELKKIEKIPTKNTEAYNYYLLGRFHSSKRKHESYRKGIEYYEKAITIDPEFALAYAGLSDNFHLLALQGGMDRNEGIEKAIELAEKANTLDPNLAEPYAVLGDIYNYEHWDWEKAEQHLLKALELNPNYSTAHQYYSELLAILGKNEKARNHINKALELDPFSFVVRHFSTLFYANTGEFEKALDENKICFELVPDHDWAISLEYQIHCLMQNEQAAVEYLKKVGTNSGAWTPEELDSVFINGSFKGFYEWRLKEGQYRTTKIYCNAMLGNDEILMELLEEEYLEGRLSPMNTTAIEFKTIRSNPRFIAIREKMGLLPLQ
ncbi:helix-turn-helix domain-containing protein [Mariniphaga sp.]|uniref:helix-turn-helix domain-containing protein n=1 Tax=Mariniphaga sp. TaxID=1954475 RepID=UPI003569EA33